MLSGVSTATMSAPSIATLPGLSMRLVPSTVTTMPLTMIIDTGRGVCADTTATTHATAIPVTAPFILISAF
jgi:hypothetical protein